MGIIQRKKAILLNEPEIKTATGNGVSFIADRVADIQECALDLKATQSGSGTPSTTNIRPITGYKNFSVYQSGSDPSEKSTYSYSWLTERGDGTLNLINGFLWSYQFVLRVDGNSGWNNVGSKFYFNIADSYFQNSTSTANQICNMYPFAGFITNGSVAVTQDKHFYLQRVATTLSYCRIWVYDSSLTIDQFKAMLNHTALEFTYPVRVAAYITSYQLKAIRGENNIWNSNNGDITVKYWSK